MKMMTIRKMRRNINPENRAPGLRRFVRTAAGILLLLPMLLLALLGAPFTVQADVALDEYDIREDPFYNSYQDEIITYVDGKSFVSPKETPYFSAPGSTEPTGNLQSGKTVLIEAVYKDETGTLWGIFSHSVKATRTRAYSDGTYEKYDTWEKQYDWIRLADLVLESDPGRSATEELGRNPLLMLPGPIRRIVGNPFIMLPLVLAVVYLLLMTVLIAFFVRRGRKRRRVHDF